MSSIRETLEELALSANPFAPETPLESLFPGGMRRASLDQLQVLIREGSDIVALIGADGSGKTTLADFYARRADADQIVARIRASMLTSPAQLLQEMFKAFVLDFPAQASLGELMAALRRYFQTVRDSSRSVVLLVDDAHELGDDALGLLVKLALSDNPDNTFHLVLVGQPALLDMLDYTCPQREGRDQFVPVPLPEFELEETRNYLRYRLNAVGFNARDPARPLLFSNRQVDKIHKLSGGVPAQINTLANNMLFAPKGGVTAWLAPLREINLPPKYAYAAGALLLVLFVAFFIGGGEDDVPSAQRQIVVPVPARVAENDASADSGAVAPPVVSPSRAPQAQSDEPAAALSSAEPAPTRQAEAARSNAERAPVVTAPPAPAPVPAPVPAPAPAPVQQAARNSAAAVGQSAQVLALPAEQYTLQLLGAASRSNVEAFVARNSASPLYWFATENQGRPWYVVIHGSYASRSAAQNAANALAGELGGLQPWIRSLNAVQADIR